MVCANSTHEQFARNTRVLHVMKTKEFLFNRLMNAYSEAFNKKSKKQIQLDVVDIWNGIKKEHNIEEKVEEKVSQWKKVSLESKAKLMSMWSKVCIL